MNIDECTQRMLKEQRAEQFPRCLDMIPIRPDASFEAEIADQFARGTTREVHNVVGQDDMIIKKAYPKAVAANWVEYLIWNTARGTRWAPALGAIHCISESGQYLKMERLNDITQQDYSEVPFIPYWLNDLLPKNFGMSKDGKVKARDYGVVNLAFDLDEALPYKPAWALKFR